MKTKAHNDLILAVNLVSEVEKEKDPTIREIYGRLCHSFPVMVRTCGLCQAIAFSKDKAASNDAKSAKAHALLLDHVGKLLGKPDVMTVVQEATATEYMLHTRRVLSAWIYFKRFAVSILKVETAEDKDGG